MRRSLFLIHLLILLNVCVDAYKSFEDMMVVRLCDENGDNVLREEELNSCLSRDDSTRGLANHLQKSLRRIVKEHAKRRKLTTTCHSNDSDLCSGDGCATCVSGYNEATCLSVSAEWCACEFLQPYNGGRGAILCVDGHVCNGYTDGWNCCNTHGNRKQCPQDLPHMCARSDKCSGSYCCETFKASCYYGGKGGPRVCDEETCSAYNLASNVVTGPSDGCTNGIQLKTKSDKLCTISCASGYSGSDGTVVCVGDSNSGDPPQVYISCTENQCEAISLSSQLTGGDSDPCSNGLRLSTHSDTSCNVKCNTGYEGSGGTIQCSADAVMDASPTESVSCTEISCSAYVLPAHVTGGDSDPCTDISLLTTHSDPSCNVKCEPGFSGIPATISCPVDSTSGDAPSGSISCTENMCTAYQFDISVTQGQTDPCQNNVALSTYSDNSCNLQCNVGFSGAGGSVTCASNAENGASPSVIIDCAANTCAGISIPDYLVTNSESIVPCIDDLVLNTQSGSNTCGVKCAPGYSGSGGVIECSSTASNGDTATPNTDCVQNICSPFRFRSVYEEPIIISSGVKCTRGIRLASNEECIAVCAAGYATSSQNGEVVVKCPQDADDGMAWETSTPCSELTCPSFTYPTGVTGASTADGCSSTLSTITKPSCRLDCSVGFTYVSGSDILQCNTSGILVQNNFTCRENLCNPFTLSSGEIGWGDTPCVNNIVLNTATAPTGCTYRDAQNKSMIAICSRDSEDGDNVTIQLDDSNQLRCESFSFDTTVYQAAEINGCYSGIELSSVSDPSCEVDCAVGTSGPGGTLTCDEVTSSSGTPFFQGNCTENQCVFPSDITSLDLQESGGTCDINGVLTSRTNRSCQLKCAPGLYGTGTFTCPEYATDGMQVQYEVMCTEVLCNKYSLAMGEIPGVGTNYQPCYDDIILGTRTNQTCEVQCAEGFNAVGSGLVTCPFNASYGIPAASSLTCQEISCSPYVYDDAITSTPFGGCAVGEVLTTNTNSECSVQCKSGYSSPDGNDEGTVKCARNSTQGDAPIVSLHCTENLCAPIQLASHLAYYNDGNPSSCVESQVLSTQTNVSCNVACAVGFTGTGAVIECSTTSVSGENPVIQESCLETICRPYAFHDGITGDDSVVGVPACVENIQLSAVNNSTCAVKCAVGFSVLSGQDNLVTCPQNATFATAPYSDLICEENSCQAFNMSTLPLGVTTSLGTSACTDNIVLSTQSDSTCELVCEVGFSGTPSDLQCPSDAQNGDATVTNISCTMNTCSPIQFGVGVIGDMNHENPCVADQVLSTRDRNSTLYSSCGAKCDDGYFGLSGTITCDPSSTQGAAATWSGQCIEAECNAYEFPVGVMGGGSASLSASACTNRIKLGTHTDTTCNLMCKPGYRGADATLDCASNAMFGMDAMTSISCVENVCQVYSWPLGVTGTSAESGGTACNENTILSTHANPTCSLSCEAGFTGQDGTVTCPTDALNNQAPIANISCSENMCQSFSFDPSELSTNTRSDECPNPVTLSTRSYSTCTLNYTSGGIHTVRCDSNSNTNDTVTIVPGEPDNLCSVFYDASVQEAQFDSCVLGESLRAGESCRLECANGYEGPYVTVTCPSNASMWDNPEVTSSETGSPQVECQRTTCESFFYDVDRDGLESDTLASDPCDSSLVTLSSSSECSVRCAAGYTPSSNSTNKLRCLSDAKNGDELVLDFLCTENRCKALELSPGVVPYGATGCDLRRRLSTHSNVECLVTCAPGYLDAGTSLVKCSQSANENDDVTYEVPGFSCALDPALEMNVSCSSQTTGCTTYATSSSSTSSSSSSRSLKCESERFQASIYVATEGGDFIEFNNIHVDNETYYIKVDGNTESSCVLNFHNSKMKCPIPSGSGKERPLALFRNDKYTNQDVDTHVFEGCDLTYALPNVIEVRGCGAIGSCSRDGGDTVEIVGSNFGASSALVFVNGQQCVETAQNGHHSINCTLPPLVEQQSSNTILVIQSNQFDAYFGMKYQKCAPGERQVENSGSCVSCLAGMFSSDADSLICDLCKGGKYSSSTGFSECTECAKNTFASTAGLEECEPCARGRHSKPGAVACSSCDFFYWGSPGNCDLPVMGIIFGISMGILFASVAYFFFRKYRKMERKRKGMLNDLDTRNAMVSEAKTDIEMLQKAWEIEWKQLKIIKKIAEGGEGSVFRAKMRGMDCALKTIANTQNINMADQSEVRWMQRARHERLVMFFGCGRDDTNNIFVVLEFMAEGDLLTKMVESRERGKPMPWKLRLQLLHDVVDGMAYVHDVLGSIHRDLKSENVLLSLEKGQLRAKVADFGLGRLVPKSKTPTTLLTKNASMITKKSTGTLSSLSTKLRSKLSGHQAARSPTNSFDSQGTDLIMAATTSSSIRSMDSSPMVSRTRERLLSHSRISQQGGDSRMSMNIHISAKMTTGAGTVAYMAPELCGKEAMRNDTVKYSQAVDVFAFGVICWEALELDRAWKDEKWPARIMDKVSEGKRLPIRKKYDMPPPEGYMDVMTCSWDQEPQQRPTFSSLSVEFERLDISAEKQRDSSKFSSPCSSNESQLLVRSPQPFEDDFLDL